MRGLNNEPASEVFAQVNDDNLYRFDQVIIAGSRRSDWRQIWNLHFSMSTSCRMPSTISELCIRAALEAARRSDFHRPHHFRITEGERVTDLAHLRSIVTDYQQRGFQVAIDDFGAGYAA